MIYINDIYHANPGWGYYNFLKISLLIIINVVSQSCQITTTS